MMAGRMNPGMGAAMSIMSSGGGMGLGGMPWMPGMDDASGDKLMETVQEWLSKSGKQVAEELKNGKLAASGSKK
jgi:hypothetical protein